MVLMPPSIEQDTIFLVATMYHAESLPAVIARGQGFEADRIVSLAQRYSKEIVVDPDLSASLCSLELEESIPEELFEAVAILLAKLASRKERERAKSDSGVEKSKLIADL